MVEPKLINPLTDNDPLNVVFPILANVPTTFKLAPTLKFLAIPTPPITIKDPELAPVESVVKFTLATPFTVKLFPTNNPLAIPIPPPMITAPVVGLDVSVMF